MKKPDYSIVFPVMNQQDHIWKVLIDYSYKLDQLGFSYELIPVVNGSTDKSFSICTRLSLFNKNVRPYNIKDYGYGRGILYGFSKAKGKYFCYLNSARIHTPDLISALRYFEVNKGAIIHGVRLNRKELTRRISSKVYNLISRVFFGIKNRDINGNPNVFSRKTYEKLLLKSNNSMIDLEMLDKANRLKIPVVEIPVFNYTRFGGRSTTKFTTIFRLLKEMIVYWFNRNNTEYKFWCTFCGYPATLSKWKSCEYYKFHKQTPITNYL